MGLQDVRGIADAEVAGLVEGRPFTSLEDLRRRGRLARPTAEALCDAGALDVLCGVGRKGGPSRREVRLAVEERWRDRSRRGAGDGGGGRPEQERLELDADHRPRFPAPTTADLVRGELAALGLDVTRHVVSFYEPLFGRLGVVRCADLPVQPDGQRVRIAGVKVAIQSPAVRSGQRVMFLSLDDRTGTAQATYFEQRLDDCAWTLLHAWLLVAEGRVRRRGPRGVTVEGERVWDLSRLWRAWREGWLATALAERGTPDPHQRGG